MPAWIETRMRDGRGRLARFNGKGRPKKWEVGARGCGAGGRKGRRRRRRRRG